ncbi:MAG: hypothetical protein WDW36_003968 [Sanguina aurantia]
MEAFPLLHDLATYQATTFDYFKPRCAGDGLPDLQSWLQVFRHSLPTFHAHAAQDVNMPDGTRKVQADAFAAEFEGALASLSADPTMELAGHQVQPLNCKTLCALRDNCLSNAGFTDVFLSVKVKENADSLLLLPALLLELDAVTDGRARLELALRGVFSGNIFDLGAAASAELYEAGGGSFADTRAQLLSRPWAVDHLDAFLGRCEAGPAYAKAVMFVDNAGPDVVLGMLPFARELLKQGTKVILAANSGPSINDITAQELQPVLLQASVGDAVLQGALHTGALSVMASGNLLPVIDLLRVSSELAAACVGVDLVVLEGMGRAIETNLNALFSKLLRAWGGRLYDCVIKFDRAQA